LKKRQKKEAKPYFPKPPQKHFGLRIYFADKLTELT